MKRTSPSLPDGFKTQVCPLAAMQRGLEAHARTRVPNLPTGWSAETCFKVRIKESIQFWKDADHGRSFNHAGRGCVLG